MLKRRSSPPIFREKAWFRWPLLWLLTANIAVLIGCLAQWRVFETLEHKTYDWRLQQRGVQPMRTPIVIIAIDTPSLEISELSQPQVFWGATHARVLRILKKAGAKAIGFDIIQPLAISQFFEGQNGKLPDDNPDQILAVEIMLNEHFVMVYKRDLLSSGISKDLLSSEQLRTALALGGGGAGFDKTSFDSDAIVRRFTLRDVDGELSFPLRLAVAATGKEPIFKPGELRFGDRRIPLNSGDEGFISYLGPDGTFPRISYKELLANPQKYSSTIKNSVCLIGFTSEQYQDFQSIPLFNSFGGNQRNLMAGVEIHANVLHTLLSGPFISQPGAVATWAWIVLAAFLVVPLSWWPRTGFLVPILFCLLLCWVGFCLLSFVRWNLDLPLVAVAMSLTLSQIATTAARMWQENQSKNWIENTMGRHLPPQVVEHLRQSPDALAPGGQRREVTILFSDIRSFTRLSESLSPEKVTSFLNDYLNEMVEIIYANGGMVDKFMGDGIMVIYNWPIAHEDHALGALRTAVEMQESVAASAQRWREMGMPTIEIGVGMHTGPAVLGSIGSTRQVAQTAIGDTVNVASRIEGLCKTLGKSLNSGILLSETTYNAAKSMQLEGKDFPYNLVPAAETEVRGRREALQLFAVCQQVESAQKNEN